jgi:hypothetical protein
MSADRFAFQRDCIKRALAESDGLALNVGCNDDDPRHKQLDPVRVVNCDLFAHDQVLDRPNAVDVLFDAARDEWPFESSTAALVVLGDILEHLTPEEIGATLREARRVGRKLCITVPEDHRDEVSNERADTFPRGAVHRTTVTRALLEPLLEWAGWHVTGWQTVEYDDGRFWGQRTMGHFVQAD